MLFDLKIPGLFDRTLSYAGSLVNLNARVCYLGHEYRDNVSYDWDGMNRGEQELSLWQFTLSGRGCLIYEGKRYDLNPGEAMLLHIPHRHRYFLPPDSSHWEFIFMIMRGAECLRLNDEIIRMNGPVIRYPGKSPSLVYAEDIFKTALEDHQDQYRLSGLVYSFCMALLAESHKEVSQDTRPLAIEKAVQFALNHFDEPIAVADLSEASGLSRYHFSREFNKYLNITPAGFIHKLRIEKAVNMLQAGDLTSREIADRCGFQSASYFCRAFFKEFQVSPGKFRSAKALPGEYE